MNFLEKIFERLKKDSKESVLEEVRGETIYSATGMELLARIWQARAWLKQAGAQPGERCVLLGANSILWAAADLALMAEGIVVVPLYARQSAKELAVMMRDAAPARILCADAALGDAVEKEWPEAPAIALFDDVFGGEKMCIEASLTRSDAETAMIIYTSGTSGEPKGVMLSMGNVDFILGATTVRLDQLMGSAKRKFTGSETVFHYLPFCFAGSWILLLSCLMRNSRLVLSTDLTRLAEEMKLAAPEYFLNVPALLERVRGKIEGDIAKRGGLVRTIYRRARLAYLRRQVGKSETLDPICLRVAGATVFRAIRKGLGPNLQALFCGSASLAPETQLFFFMVGIPVLQVYGLTETTAICTMDEPGKVTVGRVGPAIPGVEMKLGENDEILARGPNIFQGYWRKLEATAKVFRDGCFHTGDQGDADAKGNWRITGRIKDLIILSSGHNIAPEPVEDKLAKLLPGVQQVMLVGNGRSYLGAILAGTTNHAAPGAGDAEKMQAALDEMNAELPHYKQIRAFVIAEQAFSGEEGLMTANGKLRREAIAARFADEIEKMYSRKSA
ncbi:MAG: AMP-dependent synthetase/ligase [Candidatus Acidiferrales bacterium]